MSETIVFRVKGRHDTVYESAFRLDGDNLTAWCTCSKGELGQYCVHVLSILLGEGKGVIGDTTDQVEKVRSWVEGTDVGAALMELAQAELALGKARQEVERAREKVSQAIRD